MRRRNGQKYYPPPEFVPVDVDTDGGADTSDKRAAPVFSETVQQLRDRQEEEEKEERERKVRVYNALTPQGHHVSWYI